MERIYRRETDAAAPRPTDTEQPALAGNNSNVAVTEPLPAARFSYYRGGIRTAAPYATVTPRQLWDVVSGPTFAPATAQLRAEPTGSPARAELKKALDYVTPAGTFAPTRANGNLVAASGLLVLDFDHLPDVAAARAALLSDALLQPALVLLFASPGGEGLKALVETDPGASHLDNFRALSAYLSHHHGTAGLVPDPSGKDVARACFVCHDAEAWLSPRYVA
ncbi:BT4734/BF3469 family protein [Hymenobacter coalescens]